MNKNAAELKSIINMFKHKKDGTVEFAEVDSFGVVHNIKYLYWLESARTDYFRILGAKLSPDEFINDLPLMVVHSEIDYMNAARFNDQYQVFTRVSSVRNSSLNFENIITLTNGIPLVSAKATLVHLNVKENKPQRISDDIRLLLKNYEGENIKFLD